MPTTMIEFRANGRMTPGYLATPQGGAKGPAVIVIQEWWGLVDHIKRVADRFAAEGFVALAPDLYHGESTTSPDEAGRKMMALDIAQAGKDLVGAADYLLSHESVAPKKVAALGFCMGGQLALYAATAHEQIAAAVDFYGIHPAVKPDFSKLRGPVLAHFGKKDGFVKEADARALVETIQAAGAKIDAHFYESGHAFFNDARPEAYDKSDAELAWQRTIAFLRDALS
jgi:carboxymethylenebutenolidase